MGEIDHQQLLREIDAEVKARRASGDFPAGMERDLDLVFARFAPATVNDDDLHALIESAERKSYIDPIPIVASRMPMVSLVKRTENKLLGWFFRYLAQQVTAFADVVVHALRQVQRRVEALEHATAGADPALVESARLESRQLAPVFDTSAVMAHLADVTGRVLVGECGDGALVRVLAGHDVYGVEPQLALAESATRGGLDVRADDLIEHLRGVDAGALAGLVLVGLVDRLPLGGQIALVERAARVVGEGGRLVLLGTAPEAWGRANPVEADLAPGHPLRPATWIHLLEQQGFLGVRAAESDGTFIVTATR